MSYFRGEQYLWRDSDENLHIWSETRDHGSDTKTPLRTKQMIVLSKDVFDQLAVMRFCQLVEEGGLEEAIRRASKSGNGGGLSVKQNGQELLNRLRSMPIVKVEAYVAEEGLSLKSGDRVTLDKANRSARKSE